MTNLSAEEHFGTQLFPMSQYEKETQTLPRCKEL